VESDETRDAVHAAVAAPPDGLREAVLLRYMGVRSHAESPRSSA
jgi:hypothetical protein